MYHDSQMRRWLSIPLLVFFWLAPLAALLPGTDEAHLPACCRRHGVHHCVMSAHAPETAASGHVLSAPSRCPHFPSFPFAAPADFALTHPIIPALHGASPLHIAAMDSAANLQPRNESGRGPPSLV